MINKNQRFWSKTECESSQMFLWDWNVKLLPVCTMKGHHLFFICSSAVRTLNCQQCPPYISEHLHFPTTQIFSSLLVFCNVFTCICITGSTLLREPTINICLLMEIKFISFFSLKLTAGHLILYAKSGYNNATTL